MKNSGLPGSVLSANQQPRRTSCICVRQSPPGSTFHWCM